MKYICLDVVLKIMFSKDKFPGSKRVTCPVALSRTGNTKKTNLKWSKIRKDAFLDIVLKIIFSKHKVPMPRNYVQYMKKLIQIVKKWPSNSWHSVRKYVTVKQ